MKPGDEFKFTAAELAYGGDAVGKADDGRVVFVPYMAPGDQARIRIEKVKKGFARAWPVEILSGGPDRVTPPCRVFGVCGGCQWQHVGIAAQRAAKERILRRLLEPLGLDRAVESLRGGQNTYGYRNRLILPLRAEGRGLRAGFFRAGSHELAELDSCPVQQKPLWDAAWQVVSRLREMKLPGYDETKGKGLMRHLVVRRAAGTGEIGVILVATQRQVPALEKLAKEMISVGTEVSAVSLCVNSRRTNVVLGRRLYCLAGKTDLNEQLRGISLRVPLAAFFQANAEITGFMIDILRSWMDGETGGILDLYCGVGILGIAAAGAAKASWLTGVEDNMEAVKAAQANVACYPSLRARFLAGEAGEIMGRIRPSLKGLGTIIVDPPRKGLSTAVLREVNGLKARRLIYVSCDPVTFARDLRPLLADGYRVKSVVPLDMFPQTFHVELMADLLRD